jgi:undecaprenyl diphosphate synthase
MIPPLNHVAIIMDGNRRWAKLRGLPPVKGHEASVKQAIEPIIRHLADKKIPYVTFWAFSTENWKRDEAEIKAIFDIFRMGLSTLAINLINSGARFRLLGDINKFPKDIAQKTLDLISKSKGNTTITTTFALNYGGRDEILRAVKKIIKDKKKPEKITEQLFSGYLDTAGIPDPDLVIRTGGEKRLSGYLPWQTVYSELIFTPTLFPDFTPEELDKALAEYADRDRRFGGDTTPTNK